MENSITKKKKKLTHNSQFLNSMNKWQLQECACMYEGLEDQV